MVSVASLLNKESEQERLPTPTASIRQASESSPAPSERPSKKPRLAKDAAVFTKNKVVGEVRYTPYETSDQKVLQEMERFGVYPMPLSDIIKYPRHIPYNSEKKKLYLKTGRDAFEVFQYTFHPPGHNREYVVLWDYNIGLVRMTPFFKCCNFPKTIPAKMLNLNPGLKEICHSITGGALVAQGYWVPYEAAKALASTFCWDFRYALVPVFGPDFPALCAKPGSDSYSTMIIDDKIIQQCTDDVEMFRSMQNKVTSQSEDESVKSFRRDKPRSTWQDNRSQASSFRPVNRANVLPIEAPIESPYSFLRTQAGTPESSCLSSPVLSTLTGYSTPVTPTRSSRLPSPNSILEDRSQEATAQRPNSPSSTDSNVSPKTMPRKRRYFGGDQTHAPSDQAQMKPVISVESVHVSQADLNAAEILVGLRIAVRRAREEDEDSS